MARGERHTMEEKLAAVALMEKSGTQAALEQYKVARGTLYAWRKEAAEARKPEEKAATAPQSVMDIISQDDQARIQELTAMIERQASELAAMRETAARQRDTIEKLKSMLIAAVEKA